MNGRLGERIQIKELQEIRSFDPKNKRYKVNSEIGRYISQDGPHHAVRRNNPQVSVNTTGLFLHMLSCRSVSSVSQGPRLTKFLLHMCPPNTEVGKGNVVD